MKVLIIIIYLLIHSSILLAVGDPEVGRNKARACIGCHGFDGNNSNDAYPKLAGQNESYLSKQLFDFKSGARKEEQMTSMVKAIDAIDIPDIAAYFSSQKRITTTTRSVDIDKNTLGKKIYLNGIFNKDVPTCSSCHGINGEGNQSKTYPLLMKQHAKYTSKALKDFRSYTRKNDPISIMRKATINLNDKEIDALSKYIETLN